MYVSLIYFIKNECKDSVMKKIKRRDSKTKLGTQIVMKYFPVIYDFI